MYKLSEVTMLHI